MDNNEFDNKVNSSTEGDYLAPERKEYVYSEPVSEQPKTMKFDPETGRPLEQEIPIGTQERTSSESWNQYTPNSGYSTASGNSYQGANTNQYNRYTNNNMYAATPNQGNTGFGIASLVLGIVSIVLCCTCVEFITGPLAIIFGIVHLTGNKPQKGLGIAGIICGVAGLLLGILLIASFSTNDKKDNSYIDEIFKEFENGFEEGFDENFQGLITEMEEL